MSARHKPAVPTEIVSSMKPFPRLGRVALLLAASWLAACVPLPSRNDASLSIPGSWDRPVPGNVDVWPGSDWWHGFSSAELDTLIATARQNNLDLSAAAARLIQAQNQARIAGVALLPTLDGSIGTSRAGIAASNRSESTSFNASLSASYELDFWGANRADVLAAQATLRSSRYDRETVALTVTTGVANTYLQVLSLRERLATARQNLEIAERVLNIVQARVRGGAATRLDLAQQLGTVAGQRAALPPLEQQERDALSALAILLGRLPQGFSVQETSLDAIQIPAVAPGMPSDLLMRRPDLRRAESQLDAADANVAAARAALFPSVRLTAGSGAQSAVFSTLFDESPGFSIGVSLARALFDSGRLGAQRKVADARRVEIIQTYRTSVITAFADVDKALGNADSIARQQEQQAIQLEQARIALDVAEIRYRAGAVDLLTLLDAQRTLYSAQDQSRQLKLSRLQAVVTLFRVLGGGWQDPASAL
jgi:NodT family efflux transporter outer membrane factor (OMF) lipoprotein